LKNGHRSQAYNAVDDEPVTQLAFYQWLASALGNEAAALCAGGR